MDFVIHYGAAAGFEEDALALARRLFAYFDEAVDSLALIPVSEAEFDLHLNGALVHSYRLSGRAPRVSDLKTSACSATLRSSAAPPRPD